MFYILNFETHDFISCDNANIAESHIRKLLSAGCNVDSLEIINGFADEIRFSVDQFREHCQEWSLTDDSSLAPLPEVKAEVGMVGTIKNNSEIKKGLRGKLFLITAVSDSGYLSGTIEGKTGIYAVLKDNLENLSFPENSKSSLKSKVEASSARSVGADHHFPEKDKEAVSELSY